MIDREHSETATSLPPGATDPNLIYISVGKSIHRWEQLEQAFARLYVKLTARPDLPESYLSFGQKNGTFTKRMAALVATAEAYFIKFPDQHKENAFQEIETRAQDLSIERHRIAHGHITMWGEFKIPEKKGPFVSTATMHYRWAPPFYGARKLRTNPVGHNAETIDAISQPFEELHNKVFAFTEVLQQTTLPRISL
jgi:hypothetical protein